MRGGCGGRTLLCARTKTGRLFGARISGSATRCSFSFNTQDTREVSSVLSVSARKQGEKKCTLQSLDFCANCLVPAMTCGEVLSNYFFSRIRQLRWISRNFPRCTCSWQLNTSLSTPFAGYQGCDLCLGLSHPLTVLNRMSHGGIPTLLENDRYQEIEEEDWVKCLHRAHSSSASAGRELIQHG